MDWFEKLTGFREIDYYGTRARLRIDERQLHSRVNGATYSIGQLEVVSLANLAERMKISGGLPGRLSANITVGDVRQLHQRPENRGALFQVASQFNLLEMSDPSVTPEHGVTRYQYDFTQGPACAIAAGAATIYRNYFVPTGGGYGQTTSRQIDALSRLGEALGAVLGMPQEALWTMRNGYAFCTRDGLDLISAYLAKLSDDDTVRLRGHLCIGLHWDVAATETAEPNTNLISQAFCAALPVAYSQIAASHWEPFARLILEAAYEATLCAAALNARRGLSNRVFLTFLGGGAFGNKDTWIYDAIRRALARAKDCALDVQLVSYSEPTSEMLDIIDDVT